MKESLFVRIRRWFTNGGTLKMIGRTFLILGLIAAFTFACVGFDNMVDTRDAAQIAKYEENVKKAQDRAYKQLEKDAKKAIKNGETPPEIPADPSMIEVEVKPVVYDLSDYLGEYITVYILRAVLCIAAGVALCWFFCNVQDMLHKLVTTERKRVVAAAFFWIGVLAAVIIAAFGVVAIMEIKKSTLSQVGDILMKEYIVWSIVAFGCGLSIHQLILRFGAEKKRVENCSKGNALSHAIYLIVLALCPFAVTACAAYGAVAGWGTAALCALGVLVVLVLVWILSGVCPFIRSKEEAAAEAQRKGHSTWVCSCGHTNARNEGVCSVCGEIKPKH